MDFAAMKRRELQALCKRHGLAAGGTNADLVARLTATLSSSGGAAQEAVGVVVGKGCLKRSAGGASGGDSDAAKKVTFELEEDEEAEAGFSGRGRRRSQVMSSPAVAKTRGRGKAGEDPHIAKGIVGGHRRTRSHAGGDSADESDPGETGADAPVRRSVTRKNSAYAEQEVVGVGDAAGMKHQMKRKTRENDIEDVDVSGQVGASRRSTRSSSHLLEPAALLSPVEKKRGRRKAAYVNEKTCVEEQPTEALHSGRTLRSGVVVVAAVPPIVSESKNSRLKVQEEEPAVEKVAKVEVPRRTTRSSAVSAPLTSPNVTAKKRGRKADDVHSDGGPDKKMENKGQSTTRSSIHHLASTVEEASIEQVAKVKVPSRTTRSSAVAAPLASPSVTAKKRGRKTDDVHSDGGLDKKMENKGQSTTRSSIHHLASTVEEASIEQVAKVEVPSRTTRSSAVAAPLTSPSVTAKKRGRKTDDVHSDGGTDKKMENKGQSTTRSSIHHLASTVEEASIIEQVAKVEVPRRTTRSSAVAAPLTSPSVTTKKRGRKPDDVHSDGGPDKKMENKRQSTTRSSIHHLASTVEEASIEQVAAPSKGLPPRRSTRNTSEANLMLNSNKTSESINWSRAPTEGHGLKIARPTMLNTAKDDVEKPDRHVGLKKSKLRNVSATVGTNGGEIPSSDSTGKVSATDMQIEVPGPVRRSTRKSVVPSSLEHETNDMVDGVEKKQTVTKPVGRSTRRSVAPVILEKESKGPTKEIVPEPHVKRQTRKSVVPAMLEKGRKSIITETIPEARVKRSTRKTALPMVNSENNDHSQVVSSGNLQSDKSEDLEKQPTVKQPVRRLTRKSAVPAMPENDRKGVPDMLNNENSDRTEVQSDKAGHLEKQLVVKEPVRKSTGKSVVPDVIEKENKGLHEKLKSEVSVRTPVCKSVVPNAVNKENNDHNEFIRTEELSVKTRSTHTRLQVALQNDQSVRRTTRRSSNLTISPPQSKPAASKGRPAKRRRTSSLQEDMPAEQQNEDPIDYGAHTMPAEVATSIDLAIGVPPFTGEKSNLQDLQLNSELEGMVVVEPGLSRDKEDNDSLVFQLEGTVGTTGKPPSSVPIPDCKHVGPLSEEAVHSIENDAGRFSPNFEQSPTGLQFILSLGIAERSTTHNAIPCTDNSVEESDVLKVECGVETVVSSISDSHQRSDENPGRVEESGDCTFSSQQNNEQEGFLVSSWPKDLVASAQLDLSEDADHVVRDDITKDLICKEEQKKDFIPSDINVPHEISPANEPAENAAGVSEAVFCISQSTPISDEVNPDSSRLESPDSLNNHIASSNTEAVQQDNKEECNVHNGVTHGIDASGMSEAAQVEVSKSGKMLLPDVETSAFQDAQLNRKLEGNELEEDSFSCGKDESGKNSMSQLADEQEGFSVSSCPKDLVPSAQLDLSDDADHVVRGDVITKDLICKEEEKNDFIPSDINVRHEISPANEPAENASGVSGAVFCISQSIPISDEANPDSSRLESLDSLDNHIASSNTEAGQQDNKEECNVHNGVTHGIDASGMSEAAQVEVSKGGKMLLPDVETSSFRDAQLIRRREGNEFEEDSFSCGKDESGKNSMSQLADEYVGDSCQEQELKLPHDMSAVKSPKGSTTCQDEFVIGSGVGRTSGSIVKGNNIAMDAPGTAKQGDNLGPSATALLNIRENTPACKIDYPELSSDHLSEIDSSSRAVQSLSGRLREGLAVGNPDDKPCMEQVQQDDVQVLEGTIENTALGSATPVSNQRRGLSEEAEPHSLKIERSSSTVEQSSFGLRSLFLQNDLQVQKGTLGKTAIVSATPVCKDEYGLPDKAELHSSRNVICSSSVEHSPFRLQNLFSPDDVHVEEGTLEKATLSSSTPECGLPDEAGPHTFVKIRSSSVEQSPFCLQSLFSQDDVQVQDVPGTLEKAALGSATPECKHECGLPDEAEPHSLKTATPECKHECGLPDEAEPHLLKEICSSSVEQSLFGLQSIFSEDDAHIQGTVEKAALGSVTPECKHECGLPDEAEPHSVKNERCSTSVEQSPSGLQLSQKSIEEPSENAALAVHAKNGVDESKEIHGVEKPPMPESVSDDDSSVDFSAVSKSEGCAYTSDQGNEYEGLTESCHEQEQIACQLDLLEAANCMEDFTNPEEVSYDKENKKPFHSTDISSSCEKIDVNGPVKHASGLGDGLFSSSQIASTDDTDVHPSSNPSQFESTDFLDAPKGCCSTEALQQGLKEQHDEPTKKQVTYGAYASDMMEPGTAKDLESEVPPLPAEETSNMLEYLFLRESSQGSDMHGDIVLRSAENEDHSNTCHVELQVGKTVSSEPDSSKGSDMHGDYVLQSAENEDDSIICQAELQVEKMDSSEPDSHQGSNEDLTVVEGSSGCIFSSQLEHEKDKQLIAPLLAAETLALPDEQANPELEAGEFEKCNFTSEDTSGKIGTGYVKNNLFQLPKDYHMEAIQGKELPDDLPAPKFPGQSTIGQDADTLPLPDEKSNPELEGGEVEEHNFGSEDRTGIFGTGYARNYLFHLHEDSGMDSIQGKELPNGPEAPRSLEESTICQDAGTPPLPDEQSNLEPEGGEVDECNFGSEDTSCIFGTGYVRNNLFQLHEDSRMYSIQGKELPNGSDAPKSIEQSTIGPDAETSALLDEHPNSELDGGEVEEGNFSSEYASGIFGTGYMEDNLFQLHEYSHMDPVQGKELPNYLHAPKSPKQSIVGRVDDVLGPETSPLPDEKFDPVKCEELKEHNHSCDKAASDIFSSGSAKNICHWDDKDECNKHSDDRATAAILSSGMTKPTLIEGSGSGMALLSAAEAPALTDEQLNSTLEDKEQDLCFDTDTINISDSGLMENSDLFTLPEDSHTEICYEHELPIGTPAAKSAEESAVCPDGSVPGSVGTCQTSGRGRISEISKKLLRFKISSTVKGSYIAMDSANTKQVDSPSLISLLGNTESVPAANPDHLAELNTDWLDATDSSRQGTTDGL